MLFSYFSPRASGFNPRWDCTFNFTVHCPDLALVRFMVEDYDYTSSNDFLGQCTLPFHSLLTGQRRGAGGELNSLGSNESMFCFVFLIFWLPFMDSSGYRHVRLLKLDGSSLSPSSLFIHVKISPCESSPSKASAKSPTSTKSATKKPWSWSQQRRRHRDIYLTKISF